MASRPSISPKTRWRRSTSGTWSAATRRAGGAVARSPAGAALSLRVPGAARRLDALPFPDRHRAGTSACSITATMALTTAACWWASRCRQTSARVPALPRRARLSLLGRDTQPRLPAVPGMNWRRLYHAAVAELALDLPRRFRPALKKARGQGIHARPPRRPGLHLRHRRPGHARLRHGDPAVAEAGAPLRGRRYRSRCRHLRLVRWRIRRHAVPVRAVPGRALRPFGAAA